MSREVSPSDRLEMIAAARLSSEERNQKEIAEELNISQPKVSRLLESAKEEKILARAPAIIKKNISKADWDRIEELYFGGAKLRKTLEDGGIRLPTRFHIREFKGNREQFARSAAGRVLGLLRASKLVGMMSGETMFNLVEGIKFLRKTTDDRSDYSARFIPLCGDPIHLMNQRLIDYSASHLAASLGDCITGNPPDEPCLTGVPAYISSPLQESVEFKAFLNSIPGYYRIFGSEHEPLVNQVDSIITGIGVIRTVKGTENSTAAFIRERIEQKEESAEFLGKIVHGDIGGLLIEKRASEKKAAEKLNKGWIGIRAEHFQRVATAAKENGWPGVIVVAFGEQKAGIALEVIRRGFVNELIIDSTLSMEIQKLASRA